MMNEMDFSEILIKLGIPISFPVFLLHLATIHIEI